MTCTRAEDLYEDVTLDSTIRDYCREEGSHSENARSMARWLRVLERVGAEVLSVSSNEVSWRMTLRQAFDTGWGFDQYGSPEAYVAAHLDGHGGELDYLNDDEEHPLIRRVRALWDEHLRAPRTRRRKKERT